MRLLVDTSAYSAFMRGYSAIKSSLQQADDVVVNAVVLGELAAGFIKADGAAETRKSSADFSAHRGSMLST
jgi:predicted nucleic acid-binding protein